MTTTPFPSDNASTVARPDVEALLQHGAWLNRLAARLLRGADDAGDAVQETWVAVLRAGVGHRYSPRAWLRQLLRGRVLHGARSQTRRQRREQAAMALAEDQAEDRAESAAATLEHLSLQRRLTELVTSLPEPFRTTITMRYFEDRSAAQIARALNVPAGTVRWRTREALQRLRAALDHQDAAAPHAETGPWRLALAPLARAALPVRHALGGLLLVGATVAMLAAAAAILLLASRGTGSRSRPRAAAASDRPTSGAPRLSSPLPSPAAARAPRPQGLMAETAAAPRAGEPAALPPGQRLAGAERRWRSSCPSPEALVDHHGLCAAVVEPAGDLCPAAGPAGRRLVSLGRPLSPEGALAVEDFRALQADPRATAEQQGAARLRLAEARFEEVLAIAPLMDLALDKTDTAAFNEDQRRFTEWMQRFGTSTSAATRELERLGESIGTIPETAALARARQAELLLAAGRLLLATEIPSALVSRNSHGADERAMFCQSIGRRAEHLFDKAFVAGRACLTAPPSARAAATASRCQSLIDALPPRTGPEAHQR